MITGGSEGATARHLAFGHAARNGIACLLAAEQGFTGPKRAFEDPRGFCLTLCAEPKWQCLSDLGTFYLPEVAFKPYPCARQLHAGVEALLKILQEYRLKPGVIDEIELSLPTANASMVDRPSITPTHAATVGSGQYVMAVTAFRGKIDLQSFEEEFLNLPPVRDLMGKVKVVASSALDHHFPRYWPGAVTVRSGDKAYSEAVMIPKGESGNPMSPAEVRDKFVSLAVPVIGAANAKAVVQEVEALDQLGSLDSLLSLLKPPFTT
jgi:2-methylcitrate dehydratase PrpD